MNQTLNLGYLKFFHDAALSGSISESAKRNFVTQSAVSQGIAKLETSLQARLCDHKKQKFTLTDEGLIVFDRAKEVFSAVRSLHDAVDKNKKIPRMPVNFVCTHSIGLTFLPEFLQEFEKKFPHVAVHFLMGGLSQIRGWLKQGIAEFALVLESPDFSEYDAQQIYEGVFGIFKHKKEKANIEKRGVYVEHREGFLVPELLALYKKQWGRLLPVRSELNSWELIGRCLQLQGGYGFLPDHVLRGGRYPEVARAKGLLPEFPYAVAAVALKGAKLSYSALTFIENMKRQINV